MTIGRRQPEPAPGNGSGVSIGGNNTAPIQNVTGDHISHIRQSASTQSTTDIETVRSLLASFRSDVERHAATLPHAEALRAMADTVDSSLATPSVQQPTVLRQIAQTLPALVVGTVVQQGGEALAQAVGALLS
ncbi:hypothetical protein ABZ883_42155 [Streptomyces sp. NPDC046977]|uniref:hypothetical protein n=1 Tax=Streptomyces sp. NPDC046977 TaxID=3154703 RepID=UPI0033DFF992